MAIAVPGDHQQNLVTIGLPEARRDRMRAQRVFGVFARLSLKACAASLGVAKRPGGPVSGGFLALCERSFMPVSTA